MTEKPSPEVAAGTPREHTIPNYIERELSRIDCKYAPLCGPSIVACLRVLIARALAEVAAGTAQEPLACPFCGGRAYATRTVNGTQMFKVGCASCGIEMKAAWYRDEPAPTKDILSLWNQRTPADAAGNKAHDEARAIIARMRSDAARFRVFPGSGEVVDATHVDEWADELETALAGDAAGTPREEEKQR
jgi:hypothetical protein